ncbi:MAG: hypothetical protein HY897_00400 [Deltaproteobacteria bacterium]|nr:hypothetical protein [Deltaproteobacteria bacterium]
MQTCADRAMNLRHSLLLLTPFAPCLLLLTPLFLAGCGCDQEFALPEEAKIACVAEGDCPTGWTCNTAVGQCVKMTKIDKAAPGLKGEVTLDPPVLKKGATATLSFEVAEELLNPPEVKIRAGVDRLLVLDEKASDRALKYVYTYKAAGDEPQDTDCPLTISLTDKSGNTSSGISGKSLKFDFLPPSIPADKVLVTGSPAKKDGVVTVKFSVSEPLASDPVVVLTLASGLTPLALDPSSTGLDYVYTYTSLGNESEDPAGHGILVDLNDLAGNVSTALPLEKPVVFDFTPPGFKTAPVVDPPDARAGTLVTVTLEADEDLGSEPIVKLGAIELRGTSSGRAYAFNHIAAEADGGGDKALSISMTDKAGNPATIAGQTVVFDFTPPAISNPSVTPPVGREGTVVRTAFTVDAALMADPVVKAGSILFSKVGEPRGLTRRVGQVLPSAAPEVEYVYEHTLAQGDPSAPVSSRRGG